MRKRKNGWKKWVSVMTVAAMAMCVFTGCSGNGGNSGNAGTSQAAAGSESGKTASGDKFKVAWISSVNDNWHHQNCTISKDYIEKNTDNVEINIMDCKNWDEAEIGSLLEQIQLAGDYDLLIMGTQSDRTDTIQELQKNGTHVILAVGSYPWAEGIASTCNSSEYEMARLIAEAAINELPQGAKVVLLRGMQGYWGSEERGKAFHDVLETRDDITILDEQYATFDKAKAMAVMDDWITAYGDEITGVISENDVMALGAIESMNAASMSTDDVYVYGIDGLYQGCKAVEEGIIRATCYNDCQKFAEVYLDRIKKLQSGELDASYVEDIVLTPVRIDKSNVQEYLDFYKENGFDK